MFSSVLSASILNILLTTFRAELAQEAIAKEKKDNPANFGANCPRHCICEVPGQVPCPAIVMLPDELRGKIKNAAN